jgi:hypothetical protein
MTKVEDMIKNNQDLAKLINEMTSLCVHIRVDLEQPIDEDQTPEEVKYDEGIKHAQYDIYEKLEFYIGQALERL